MHHELSSLKYFLTLSGALKGVHTRKILHNKARPVCMDVLYCAVLPNVRHPRGGKGSFPYESRSRI